MSARLSDRYSESQASRYHLAETEEEIETEEEEEQEGSYVSAKSKFSTVRAILDLEAER